MSEQSPLYDERLHRQCLYLRLGGLSYAQISSFIDITRQRVQQIVSPPDDMRAFIIAYNCGLCEMCSALVGASGHIHHRSTEVTPEEYNAQENLTLLCPTCHPTAHAGPIFVDRTRRRTPEELAASRALYGEKMAARYHGLTLAGYQEKRASGVDWCSYHKEWEPEDGFYRKGICVDANRQRSREHAHRLTIVGPGTRPVEASYRQGASRLGISYDEYVGHLEDGDSWCSGHRAWHPSGAFAKNKRRPGGLTCYCRAFDQERYRRRKAAAS